MRTVASTPRLLSHSPHARSPNASPELRSASASCSCRGARGCRHSAVCGQVLHSRPSLCCSSYPCVLALLCSALACYSFCRSGGLRAALSGRHPLTVAMQQSRAALATAPPPGRCRGLTNHAHDRQPRVRARPKDCSLSVQIYPPTHPPPPPLAPTDATNVRAGRHREGQLEARAVRLPGRRH